MSWGLSSPRVWADVLAFVTSPSSPYSPPHSPAWAPGWMAPAASPLVPWGQLLSGALGHHGREAHPGVSRGQPPAGSCLGKVTTRRAGAGEAGVLGEGSRWELSIRASPWLQARRSVIITPACELSVFRYPDGGASKNVPSVCWGRKVKMSQAARPAPPGQHRRSNKGGKTRWGPGGAPPEALPERWRSGAGRGGGRLLLL